MLQHMQVTFPLLEVVLLLGLVTFCLLFHSNRLGLLVAYLFAYRWGWMVFDENPLMKQNALLFGVYFIFGLVTALTAVVNLFFFSDHD